MRFSGASPDYEPRALAIMLTEDAFMETPDGELNQIRAIITDLLKRVERLEERVEVQPTSGAGAEPSQVPAASRLHGARTIGPRSIAINSSSEGRQPNLETRIGSQWLNRIGIIAVLIGVSYFLKYAFENYLVPPLARVGLGLLGGIVVMGFAEWVRRRNYRIFSYSLNALGLGILYLSVWAASELYGLISLQLALGAMLVITAASAVLALRQDAEILGMFALIGGFATPVLLSSGRGGEVELFTYVLILDLATLVLVSLQPWRRLLLLSVTGAAIVYFAWYDEYYSTAQFEITLAFASLFFLIFAVAPVVAWRKAKFEDSGVLVAAVLLNALVSLCSFALLLNHISAIETSWGMLGLALFYAAVAWWVRRQPLGNCRYIFRSHVALVTGFIAIAIAFGFESGWITLFWFLEAAVLITLGFTRHSAFVRWLGLAVIAITIAKVFGYDVWRLERGFRIVSFIALGILLLTISFVYQQNWLPLTSTRATRDSSHS